MEIKLSVHCPKCGSIETHEEYADLFYDMDEKTLDIVRVVCNTCKYVTPFATNLLDCIMSDNCRSPEQDEMYCPKDKK